MPNIELYEENRLRELDRAVADAVKIISKSYLNDLQALNVVPPSLEIKNIDAANCGFFCHLRRMVYSKRESFLDKLATVANVAFSTDSTIATIMDSDGESIDYYIGIVAKNRLTKTKTDESWRASAKEAFFGAMQGNFVGSDMKRLQSGETGELLAKVFDRRVQSISSISGIVSLRNKDRQDMNAYVQGIENLTDAMRGQKYAIVMLADPINGNKLRKIRTGYTMLHTYLSAYLRYSLTLNETASLAVSKSQSESFQSGINEGIALAQSSGTAGATQTGSGRGLNANASIIFASAGTSYNRYNSHTVTTSSGKTQTVNRSFSKTSGTASGVTDSIGKATGQSLQLNYENRQVKDLLDKIDLQLKRLDKCESFGTFECATYVVAAEKETAFSVASNYNALMRGEDSFAQSSHINIWDSSLNDERMPQLLQYICAFSHPKFYLYDNKKVSVSPATLLSGQEIAIQFGLPKKSVSGLTVLEMAPFGRNVTVLKDEKNMRLGSLLHMGKEEKKPVDLNADSLTMHTFVTGSTGSGKSNTICTMLGRLGADVKFLVIEPAKGEYKNVFGGRGDVGVYGTHPQKAPLLKLNPFSFQEDVHVLEHIDRFVEIFNACWPMYAAMPAILKDAVEQAYQENGWSLKSSLCAPRRFPDFNDIMAILPRIIRESSYSNDTKGDYTGALVTRIKSLTNGINGQIFCSRDEIPNEELFDRNALIDLSRVGSSETKSLLMGILVLKLQEYRMSSGLVNSPLRHVTVLEEAHNLLRRTSGEQSQESANLQGKAVEMLANAIAEMRTYGEGFIIADQSPGLLDMSVIRNTNTKIILRLPDESDRMLVGRAAGLNDDQIAELARLKRGVAAVAQNGWLEPVLCQVDEYTESAAFQYKPDESKTTYIEKYCRYMLGLERSLELSQEGADSVRQWIGRLNVGGNEKRHLLCTLERVKPLAKTLPPLFYNVFDGKRLAYAIGGTDDGQPADRRVEEYIADLYGFQDSELLRKIKEILLDAIKAELAKESQESPLLGKIEKLRGAAKGGIA
ncbi:MAG: DUF87 domain-containing protein [Acidaminococcales bacterium]|nr:DUF87 domain-containing protein [Acidaminococcales bacterium]